MTNDPQPRPLNTRQQRILEILRDEKAMSTPMIARALGIQLDTTNHVLERLMERGLVTSTRHAKGSTGAPPQIWRLLRRAAPYIGRTMLGSHYYRLPTADLQNQREVERELVRQVTTCSQWQLMKPKRPAPQELPTLQCWRVRAALMEYTGITNNPALTGLVPPQCNDFVAYHGNGRACALLILHPVRATTNYWTRPRSPFGSTAKRPPPPGRLISYGPLAQQFPNRIAAIFPDEGTAVPYIERIEAAGLLVLVLDTGDEIGQWLTSLEGK